MPQEKSFVEIVREMVEEGHGFGEIVSNLCSLGVGKSDAEKLVGIIEGKAMPSAQRQIEELLRKKIISANAAKELGVARHLESGKRREEKKLAEAFKVGDSLLREFAPGKHLAFKQRWLKLQGARHVEAEIRKELQALFLELEEERLPYRARTKLEKVLKLLG